MLSLATLPHEKFYHMEVYERRMTALRAGEFVPPADDGYDPSADLRAHQSQHKRKEIEHESYLNKEQLQELRRVQQERIEVSNLLKVYRICHTNPVYLHCVTGWENESARHGREAKLWRADGWDRF